MMILSGRVSIKMAPVVRRALRPDARAEVGDLDGRLLVLGGMFSNYAVVQGADKFMPVDIHIPGCPPRPEALLHGFNKLQAKIKGDPDPGWRDRYNAAAPRSGRASRRRREEALASARRRASARAAIAGATGARATMPDAPGLELIAQEINGAQRGHRARDRFEHDKATLIVDAEHVLGRCAGCATRPPSEYRFLASLHAADYLPGEPRFASTTSCSTWTGSSGITSRRCSRIPASGDGLPGDRLLRRAVPDRRFQEREVYDFFGIVFRGHPDLRRILMPEDYVGWPQRRDFPVGGEPVLFTNNEPETPRWYE